MAEKITGKGTQSRVGSSNTGGRMSIRTGESGFDSAWHRLPKEIKYPVIGLFATLSAFTVYHNISNNKDPQDMEHLKAHDGSEIEKIAALEYPQAVEGTLIIRGGTYIRHTPAVANADTPEDESNLAFAVPEGDTISVFNPLVYTTGNGDGASETFYGFTMDTKDGKRTLLWVSGQTTRQQDENGNTYVEFMPNLKAPHEGGLEVISGTTQDGGIFFATADGTPIAQATVIPANA